LNDAENVAVAAADDVDDDDDDEETGIDVGGAPCVTDTDEDDDEDDEIVFPDDVLSCDSGSTLPSNCSKCGATSIVVTVYTLLLLDVRTCMLDVASGALGAAAIAP
jgi:hypothetical protein